MKLAGKRVLVTGAGHGLGKAIAFHAAKAGASVVLTDVNTAGVQAVADEITSFGGRAAALEMDVTQVLQVGAVRDIIHESGGLDCIINNAGIVVGGDFLAIPIETHQKTAAVNLCGVWNVTHAFLPLLLKRDEASIVNICSASAILPLPHAATYAATKAAVLSFSDSLKEELKLMGNSHVKVSAICPSYIATGLFEGAAAPQFTKILNVDHVAGAVVKSIEKRRSFILMPWTVGLFYPLSAFLPRNWFHALCRHLGVSKSMTKWSGHAGKKA